MKKTQEIEDLKASPLFALSLCSKELAHSNFWKWLIDQEVNGKHPFADVFLSNNCRFIKVEREKENRDLTICYEENNKRKCIFVENKIKSVPDTNQLDKYVDRYKKKKKPEYDFKVGYLTGIKATLANDLPADWEFMSYTTIAAKISKINEKNKPWAQYEIVKQYSKDLINICEVVNKGLDQYKDKYCCEAPVELKHIKLDDIFLKFKADSIKKFFEKKISENNALSTSWGRPKAFAEFNHKNATITIVYCEPGCVAEKGRIGIQIEGRQFRIYAGPSYEDSSLKKHEKLYEKLKEIKWLEQWEKGANVEKRKTSMKGGRKKLAGQPYCGYVTEKYTHIYHYWDIEEKTPIEDLWREVENKLKVAKRIIDENNLKF